MRTPLLYAMALAFVLAAAGCGGGGGGGLPGGSSSGGGSGNNGGGTGGGGGNNGGGGGGGTLGDFTAPAISNQALSAATMDFRGGQLIVSANVSDPSGVAAVVATVQKTTGGAATDVPMALQYGSTYAGTYSIPANQNTAVGQTDTYTVTVRATDGAGNTSPNTTVGTVTVNPAQTDDPVPPPPVFPAVNNNFPAPP